MKGSESFAGPPVLQTNSNTLPVEVVLMGEFVGQMGGEIEMFCNQIRLV